MLTRLRHVAAFVVLAVSLASIALWWRSYSTYDSAALRMPETHALLLVSYGGSSTFQWSADEERSDWSMNYRALTTREWIRFRPLPKPDILHFSAFADAGTRLITVPHWSLALLTLAAAFAVRPSPRFRFSLKQSLVAVTLAAGAFGLILGTIPRS